MIVEKIQKAIENFLLFNFYFNNLINLFEGKAAVREPFSHIILNR